MALNFTINFMKEIRIFDNDGSYSTAFLIRVTTKDGTRKDITIDSTEYSKINAIIKKEMPGFFRHSQAVNASAEYFSKSYSERGKIPVENLTKYTGWLEIENVIRYRIGIDTRYDAMIDPYAVDVVADVAVQAGFGFLDVGKKSPAVCIIFLFAHVAYLLYWFERQEIRFHSLLYIVGPTGVLKTSIVKVLANVLDRGKLSQGIRMSSTEASAKNILEWYRDTFFLVDDHSNSDASNNEKSKKLRFDLTRVLADDTVETKMDYTKKGKIAVTDFRTVVAFTAEDQMDVGQSTELRTVTAELGTDTVDEQLLTYYQQKDGPLPTYFSLFIQYLTSCGRELEKAFYTTYITYRNEYGSRFPKMRRLADTAAQLKLTVDVVCQFAVASNYGDVRPLREILEKSIDTCLDRQAKRAATVEPYERFVVAVFDSLAFGQRNSESGVADSKEKYENNSLEFIGFRGTKDDEEVVFLNFRAAWSLALRYFRKIGKPYYETEEKTKAQLLEHRLILGKVFRPGNGARKRLTVFRMDAVNVILEKQEV